MNFRLRYAFLFPGVNSRAELVPSHGASRRWLGDYLLRNIATDLTLPKPKRLRSLTISTLNILISSTHMSLENNGPLPFLDINITRTNGHFSTSVFHKPTSTELLALLTLTASSQ